MKSYNELKVEMEAIQQQMAEGGKQSDEFFYCDCGHWWTRNKCF